MWKCKSFMWISLLGMLWVGQQAQAMPLTSATTVSQSKVNINTANAEQLETLKGIGEAKAQAIVDYRTQHGAFKSVNDLNHIKGLSEKKLAALIKENEGRIVLE